MRGSVAVGVQFPRVVVHRESGPTTAADDTVVVVVVFVGWMGVTAVAVCKLI